MESEGTKLVSLQFFLPVYGVRDKLLASSLAGECPPGCRDCLSDWDWLWMAKTQLWNLRELPFPFSQVHVLQGGILRTLPWHQAGGIWSQAPGFGKHCLLDQHESCQGKQGFVSGFLCYEKQVVQFQPSLRQPSKTMGSAQEHLGSGRNPSQSVGEFLVHQPLPFQVTFCPCTHTRCALRVLPSVSSVLPNLLWWSRFSNSLPCQS